MSEAGHYKYPLKIPASLKQTAIRLAKEDGVSLNQWIVSAVAQKIGAVETADAMLKRRAAGSKSGALGRLLRKAPDRKPSSGDEME
jgi:hypothetical protein